MEAEPNRNPMTAEAEIRRWIAERGPITFAEFMEIALYHPTGGYYASGERVGAGGDFYTSPSVHPAFGALLAVQLYQMWELLERPAPFTVVEPGAGNGLLCRDIVTAAAGLPSGFADSLRYVCVDRRAIGGFERTLSGASRIASTGLPLRGTVGCVLSNELLDAMPVHQVTLHESALQEMYVALEADDLVILAGEPSTPLLERRLSRLGIELAEGQAAEINVAMGRWVEEAAQSLERGFILTVDYGRTAGDLYSPTERFRGTLTTYRNHMQTDRPLERVGQQDISAQVDFTSLARAGEGAGLDSLGYVSQAEFLRNLGLDDFLQRPSSGPRRQVQANVTGMRELAKPGGLGDFKVMAQGKGAGDADLWGFHRSGEALRLTGGIPVPARTAEHLDLTGGRFPGGEAELEMSWEDLWHGGVPSQGEGTGEG